jgi:2-polyprenyl-6-methoxyphenol hydroxylase-like FAD-dependent oxidoreductase
MFGENTPEVLVVGAGPVGQLAALALVRRGIRVRVVDRGLWPCAQSYALALHPKSLDLLAGFGLRQSILDAAVQVRSLGLYDLTRKRVEVRLPEGDGMAVMRQDALESLLENALKAEGVNVEWRHEVSRIVPADDHAGVTIDKFEKESRGYVVAHTEWVISKSTALEVPCVIGADGYNSRVRRALKSEFHEVGPAQYFAVFEFKSDADLGGEMRMVLGDRTTDVLWPLPGGSCRWSFQLPDYHDAAVEGLKEGLMAAGFDFPTERAKERLLIGQTAEEPVLEEGNLRALIAERAPWFKGSVGDIAWKSVVRFERRLADSYGRGRVWLAGDSAHLTGPVGIQSMNLGLAEAHDLATAIGGLLRNAEPASKLDEYDRRWTANWRQLHNLDGGLRATAETDPWIASHAATLTSCLPAYGEDLGKLAAQLGLMLGRAAHA